MNREKLKIGIVGYGYVGKAFYNFFKDKYETRVYDPAYPDLNTKEEVNECYLSIICVPTPMAKDGSCDTSIVEESIRWLETPLILVKSTISPGTTEYLKKKYKKRICFSPEYLGEGKYSVPFWKYPHPTDVKWHSFMIIGGEREDTNEIIEIFQTILGPDCRYWQTNSTTAELVKYMENAWGAMKVTFCNEFYEIAETLGVDYRELRELFLLDGRTERIHTAVFKYNRGFGGKCFPKDVNAIVKASEKAGYEPKLLKEVIDSNKRFRDKKVD
ncbi:MAG: hypothetical protein ACTSR2_00485 [Candidatus Hodarchaeales archaeon]